MARFLVVAITLLAVLPACACRQEFSATLRVFPTPERAFAMSLEDAILLSDAVAEEELRRCKEQYRREGLDVDLQLSDYTVALSISEDQYRFRYYLENAAVRRQMPWLGHPHHFTILVDVSTGDVRMMGGE